MNKWIAFKNSYLSVLYLMVGHNHEDIVVDEAEGESCISSKEVGFVFLQLVQRYCKPLHIHVRNFASPHRSKQLKIAKKQCSI